MGIFSYIRRLSAGFLPMENFAVLRPEHQQLDGQPVGSTGRAEGLALRRWCIRRQGIGYLRNTAILLQIPDP
jgi:hypothetical protein